ncbi:MAG: hypothetical protein ACLFVU_02350 [Phycisphaerae bacterium]
MKLKRTILAMTLLALGFLSVEPLWAQADEDTKATEETARVRFIKNEFDKLTERMVKLAGLLEESEPETAKVLAEAVNQARRAFIAEDMEKVAELLETGLNAAAARTGAEVSSELNRLLKLLREGMVNLDKDIQRIKEMKEFAKQIDKILQAQKEEHEDTKLLNQGDKMSQEMQSFYRQLGGIVDKHKKLMDETQKLEETSPQIQKLSKVRDEIRTLRADQKRLAKEVEGASVEQLAVKGKIQDVLAERAAALRAKIAKAMEDPETAGLLKKEGEGDSKSGSAKPGEGKSGEGKSGEGKAGEGKPGEGKAGSGKSGSGKSGSGKSGSGKSGSSLAKAAEKVGQAENEMKQAAGSLAKSDPITAANPQEQAETDLKNAEEELNRAISEAAKNTRSGEIAKKQKELSEETDKLARKFSDLQEKLAKAGVSSKSEAGKSGSGKSGKSGKAGSGKSGSGKSGSGKSGSGKSGSGKSGQQSPKNMDDASKQMAEAADKLEGHQPKPAEDHQKKALEQLEANKWELAQLKRRLDEKLAKRDEELKKKADKQKELAQRTKQTAEQMDKGDEKMPGQKSASSAAGSMSEAGSKMESKATQAAEKFEKKAIDDLELAKQELEEEIAKAEAAAQADALAKVDQMLQKVLDRQKRVSLDTRQTFDKKIGAGESYARAEELKLAELSAAEGELGEEVDKVRSLLVKEGSTVVFPAVLQEVNEDLNNVQKLLADQHAGPLTQTIQKEIERNLQEMIDAIRKELAERKQKKKGGGAGQGQGGGGGKKPLVPPVAELKMLRALQLQINSRTRILNVQQTAGNLPNPEAKKQHEALAEKEKVVKGMAEKVAKNLKMK